MTSNDPTEANDLDALKGQLEEGHGLSLLPIRDWAVICRGDFDFTFGEEPHIGLTLLLHLPSRSFILRSFGRTVRKGQFSAAGVLLKDEISAIFEQTLCCAGLNGESGVFHWDNFSPDCSLIVGRGDGVTRCGGCDNARIELCPVKTEIKEEAPEPKSRKRKARGLTPDDDPEPTVFPCEHCGEAFPSQARLNGHTKREHLEEYLKCRDCQLDFNAPSTLDRHMAITHGHGKFLCDICPKKR